MAKDQILFYVKKMERNFWIEKWKKNEINFHQSQAHPLLVQHFEKLDLPLGSRIFLPLCGKTLDVAWLLHKGYRVVGSELVEMAIEQLFEELKVKPEIREVGELKLYSTQNLDIFVGDFFHLNSEGLGHVDAVYDRASLVALPEKMRIAYAIRLMKMTLNAKQLLIVYDYDQSIMQGPPFSIIDKEVHKHYAETHQLKLVESVSVKLKGHEATEKVWIID